MSTWTSNIPSQVRTFADLAAFPVTGSVKTIYIAEDTDIAYYWTGSAYVAISIQDLSGLQSKPVVVSSNTTAQNDTVYHVVANATFTDPSPVQGRGYVVLLVNGNFSFSSGGGTFTQRGTVVYRIYHSGSWYTIIHDERSYNANNYVPQTRTINGLDLTVNRTLTTANINDSSNKRYVTDSQLTVIGNTSGTNTGDQDLSGLVPNTRTINGYDLTANRTLTASDVGAPSGSGTSTGTNTGDETQSSILSKLGWWTINDQVAGSDSISTTNTITKSIALPSVPNFLNFRARFQRTSGTTNTFTARAYLSEVDNNIGGTAILIATVAGANSAVSFLPLKRSLDIIGGNIIGQSDTSSQVTDDINSSAVRMNKAIPTGTPLYLIFAVQCANASDTARFESVQINNFAF